MTISKSCAVKYQKKRRKKNQVMMNGRKRTKKMNRSKLRKRWEVAEAERTNDKLEQEFARLQMFVDESCLHAVRLPCIAHKVHMRG